MSAGTHHTVVLFEPWSLGDVMIAAAALREFTKPAALACNSRWHPVVRAVFSDRSPPQLIAVDLPYTTRNRTSAFDVTREPATPTAKDEADLILSIRGDLRDYAAARKRFPKARVRMNGWIRFLGRKSAIVNAPYALGLVRALNRYQSWAMLTGVPYQQIEHTYQWLQSNAPRNGRVVIHLGAQWRSKQYPHVAELRDRLQGEGREVTLAAGPGDLLPVGVNESEVTRAADQRLIELFRRAEHVVTNDSGPMHLAAFIGCRTVAVIRTSPIEEWLPPATRVVRAAETPRGYRPHPRYMSDEALSGWPAVEEILAELRDQNVAK